MCKNSRWNVWRILKGIPLGFRGEIPSKLSRNSSRILMKFLLVRLKDSSRNFSKNSSREFTQSFCRDFSTKFFKNSRIFYKKVHNSCSSGSSSDIFRSRYPKKDARNFPEIFRETSHEISPWIPSESLPVVPLDIFSMIP